MQRPTSKGFTLVEVMIVVAIIALLAAIAIPNVLRGRTTANETACIGNMRAIASGLEMYRSVNGAYPATANWKAEMYDNANPDYGPPSFDADSGMTVQGFQFTYLSTVGQTYSWSAVPPSGSVGSTGTRGFFINETGIIRHCKCAAAACTTPTSAANSIDQAPDNC